MVVPVLRALKSNPNLILKWLQARQEVIVILNQLCNLRPFAQAEHTILNPTLQEFCQLVVDYLSLGHFGIYEHLTVTRPVNAPFSNRLLFALRDLTFKVLDFNDKYQAKTDISYLDNDLSKLAYQIAQCFEWEDKLLQIAAGVR